MLLPPLMLVTDRLAIPGGDLAGKLAAILEWVPPGSLILQLREEDLSVRELMALAEPLVDLCRRRKTPLLIAERFDVARAVGADGVHLSDRGLEPREVRRLWPEALIAVTCHASSVVAARARHSDLVILGPIYPTPGKQKGARWPLGPDVITRARELAGPDVTLFVSGGITAETTARLFEAGASGVAVISAVLADLDPVAAAAVMVRKSGGNSADPHRLDSPLTIDDHR